MQNAADIVNKFSEAQLGVYNWLVGELTQFAKKSPQAIDVPQMAVDLMRNPKVNGTKAQLSAALHELVDEKRLLSLTHVNDDGTINLAMARKAKDAMKTGADDVAGKIKEIAARPESKVSKARLDMSKMDAGTAVGAGMSLIAGAMSLMATMSSFGSAIQKDEQGKTQVQWSQVGLGLMYAAFTVGSAYLAHGSLKQSGVVR